jgi:pyruvate kinase
MDGVDGLVLSAETAIGDYVVESIQVMRRISYISEQNTNYFDYQIRAMRNVAKPLNVSESIASSAVTTARQVNAR